MAANAAAAAKKGSAMGPSGVPLSDYTRKEDPRPSYIQSKPTLNTTQLSSASNSGLSGSANNSTVNNNNNAASPNAASASTPAKQSQQQSTPAVPASSASLLQLGAFAVSDGRRILTPSGQPYNYRHKFYYVNESNTQPFSPSVITPPAVLPAAILSPLTSGPRRVSLGATMNASYAGKQGGESPSPLPPISSSSSFLAANAAPLNQLPFRAPTPKLQASQTTADLLPIGATPPLPVRPGTANSLILSNPGAPYAPMANPNATILASGLVYESVLRPLSSHAAAAGRPDTALSFSPSPLTSAGGKSSGRAQTANSMRSPRSATGRVGDASLPSAMDESVGKIRPPTSTMRIKACGLGMGAEENVVYATTTPEPSSSGGEIPSMVRPLTAGDLLVPNGDATPSNDLKHRSPSRNQQRNKSRLAMVDNSAAVLAGDHVLDALETEGGAYAATLLTDFPPIPADEEDKLRPSRDEVAAYLEAMATWWPEEDSLAAGGNQNTAAVRHPFAGNRRLLADAIQLRLESKLVADETELGLPPHDRSASIFASTTTANGSTTTTLTEFRNKRKLSRFGSLVGDQSATLSLMADATTPRKAAAATSELLLTASASVSDAANPYTVMADQPLSAVPLAVCGLDVRTLFHDSVPIIGDDCDAGAARKFVGVAGDDEGDDPFPPKPSHTPPPLDMNTIGKPSSAHSSQPTTARPTDVANRLDANSNINSPHAKNGIVQVASLIRAAMLLKEKVEGGGAISETSRSSRNNSSSQRVVGRLDRPVPTFISTLAKALNPSHQRLFGHHVWLTQAQQQSSLNAMGTATAPPAASPMTPPAADNNNATAASSPAASSTTCPYSLKTCIDAEAYALQVRVINEQGNVIGCHLYNMPLSEQPETTGEPVSVASLTTRLALIINGAVVGAIVDEDFVLAMNEYVLHTQRNHHGGGGAPNGNSNVSYQNTPSGAIATVVKIPSTGKSFTLPQPLQDPSATVANTRRNHTALCLLSNSFPDVPPNATAETQTFSSASTLRHRDFLQHVASTNMNNSQLMKTLTSVAFTVTIDIHLKPNNHSAYQESASAAPLSTTVETVGPVEGTVVTNAGLSIFAALSVSREHISRAMKEQSTTAAQRSRAYFDRLAVDMVDDSANVTRSPSRAAANDVSTNAPTNTSTAASVGGVTSAVVPQIHSIVEARLQSAMARTHAPLVSASLLSRASLVLAALAKEEYTTVATSSDNRRGGGKALFGGSPISRRQLLSDEADGGEDNHNKSLSVSGAWMNQQQTNNRGGCGVVECIVRSPVPLDGLRATLEHSAALIIAKDAELHGPRPATGTVAVGEDLADTLASTAAGKGAAAVKGLASTIGTAAKRTSIAPKGTLASQSNSRSGVMSRSGTSGHSAADGTQSAMLGILSGPNVNADASPLLLLAVGQGTLPDAVGLNAVVASMDAAVVVATPAKRKSVSPTTTGAKGGAGGKRQSAGDASSGGAPTGPIGAIAGVSNNVLLAPDGRTLAAAVPVDLTIYRAQHKQRLETDAAIARKRDDMIASGQLVLTPEEPVSTKGNRRASRVNNASSPNGKANQAKGNASAVAATANPPLSESTVTPFGNTTTITTIDPSEANATNYACEDPLVLSFWFARDSANYLQRQALISSSDARSWEAVTVELSLPDPMLFPIAVAAASQARSRRLVAFNNASDTPSNGFSMAAGSACSHQPIIHFSTRPDDGDAFSTTPFPRPADVFAFSSNSLDVYLRARLVPMGSKYRETNKAALHQALFATRSVARALIAYGGAPLKWSGEEATQFLLAENRDILHPHARGAVTYAPFAHASLVSRMRDYVAEFSGENNNDAQPSYHQQPPSQHPLLSKAEAMFAYNGAFRISSTNTRSQQQGAAIEEFRKNAPTPSPHETAARSNASAIFTSPAEAPAEIAPLLTHVIEMTPQKFTHSTISFQARATTSSMSAAIAATGSAAASCNTPTSNTKGALRRSIHNSISSGGGSAAAATSRVVRATFIAHPRENIALYANQVEAMARELSSILF